MKTWRAFFPAVFFTGIAFIAWDIVFTSLGIWSFNEGYTLGIRLLGMPLEEWLFFFCIPYASVFTYHCLKILLKIDISIRMGNIITAFIVVIITATAFLYLERLYTSVTFLLTSLFLIAHFFGLFPQTNVGRFYLVYAILLIPFLITNGILTGSWIDEPVVMYNPAHHLGVRVLTIPLEDTVYGLFLILMNVTIYEFLLNKNVKYGE